MAWRDWPKDVTWQPRRPTNKEYEHIGHNFQSTQMRPNTYIIHPDWISEEEKRPNAFGPRRYKPWAYEFQGARYWPNGTGDVQMLETRASVPERLNSTYPASPAPRPQEQTTARGRVYLRVVDTKKPFWRSNGKPWSESAQTPFPTYAAALPALPAAPSQGAGDPAQPGEAENQARPHTTAAAPSTGGVGWPKWAEGSTPGELSFRIGCLGHPDKSGKPGGRDYLNFANAQWLGRENYN